MNVKRFFAQTAREALRQVKEQLGGDAVILANRGVDGGVEIMAAAASEIAPLAHSAAPAKPAPARPAALSPQALAPAAPVAHAPAEEDEDFHVSFSSRLRQHDAPKTWKPFEPQRVEPPRAAPPRVLQEPASEPRMERAEPAQPKAEARPAPAAEPALDPRLVAELAGIRGLLERQLAGFAWGEMARQAPLRSSLLGELLEAGFSAELARRLADAVPAEADAGAARALLRTLLSRDLVTLGNDADIIDRGGVFALVGPTGVGKTTTTAKLAARCVVRHGAEKLALLTTDGYRIGAHEQLRIYGRILGVSVHVVRDASDLKQTLGQLRHKHMVLIDTVGMSQRDRQVGEQAAMLMNAGDVRRLLLLNATSRGETLDDVVQAYSGPDLAGCIVSKVDEAGSLAPVLDVLIRHELELFYVANGQRVPEDLHLPNRQYLLHKALKGLPEASPHRLAGDEAGLLMAAAGAAASMGGRLG